MLNDSVVLEVNKLLAVTKDRAIPMDVRRLALRDALVLKGETGDGSDIPDGDLYDVACFVAPWPLKDLAMRSLADELADGYSLERAKETVSKVNASRKLLAAVIDPSLSDDERLKLVIQLNPGRDLKTLRLRSELDTRLYTKAKCREHGITPDARSPYTWAPVRRPPETWDDVFADVRS